jgi:hypothetical protein
MTDEGRKGDEGLLRKNGNRAQSITGASAAARP